MTDLALKTARVIPTPGQTSWAQVYTFSDFFLVIVIEKPSSAQTEQPEASGPKPDADVNLAAAGKELLLRFEEGYQRVKPKNLVQFKTFLQEIIEKTTDIHIASLVAGMVGSLRTGGIYIAAQSGEVLLRRKGTVRTVLAGQETLVFASGFLEQGDLLILATDAVANLIRSEEGKSISSFEDTEDVAETLSAVIHKEENQQNYACFIAQARQQQTLAIAPGQEEVDLPLPRREIPSVALSKRISIAFPPIFLKNVFAGKSRRVILTVFLLLVVLFVASLVLGVNKRQEGEREARFAKAFAEASQKYDEGMALSDLNPTLSSKTLSEAKDIVDKELANANGKDESKERAKLLELQEKIAEGLQVALNIQKLSDVPVYYDLTVIKEGANGKSMSFFDGTILVLDGKNSTFYTLTVPKKQGTILSGNIANPKEGTIVAESGFVLDDEGIERILLSSKKRETVIAKDEEWGDIGALGAFAGNLYLLDKAKGAIYKYQGSQGERRSYLASDVHPDFSNMSSMAIDGAVWVQFLDGRITKFVQGVSESLTIQGLDTALSSPTALYTDDESERLYILDKGNKRVVVAKKDGTYVGQYVWDGMKDVTDIVASEKEKKIFLLSESKLYAIDIRQ